MSKAIPGNPAAETCINGVPNQADACFQADSMVVKPLGKESPKTAERLVTPTAVLIAVGAEYRAHWSWVFICLHVCKRLLVLRLPARFSAKAT
jgi:hypothetical protein